MPQIARLNTLQKWAICTCLLIACCSELASQSHESGLTYGVITSYVRSYYKPKTSLDQTIACHEAAGGIYVRQQVYSFGLNLGITPGVRFLQPVSAFVLSDPNPSSEMLQEYIFVDNVMRTYAIERFFVEIPLTIDYEIMKGRLQISVGASYRCFHTDRSDELRKYMKEVGVLSRLKCFLSENLAIGIVYFEKLSNFNRTSYFQNGMNYDMRGRSLQINLYFEVSER